MVGTNENPVKIPVADFNEFATLVFDSPFDFMAVMNCEGWENGSFCLFKFYVDDWSKREDPNTFGPMEVRVMNGQYPMHSAWTVLSLMCKLGYIAKGYYQIILPEKTEPEKSEAERKQELEEYCDRMRTLHSCR